MLLPVKTLSIAPLLLVGRDRRPNCFWFFFITPGRDLRREHGKSDDVVHLPMRSNRECFFGSEKARLNSLIEQMAAANYAIRLLRRREQRRRRGHNRRRIRLTRRTVSTPITNQERDCSVAVRRVRRWTGKCADDCAVSAAAAVLYARVPSPPAVSKQLLPMRQASASGSQQSGNVCAMWDCDIRQPSHGSVCSQLIPFRIAATYKHHAVLPTPNFILLDTFFHGRIDFVNKNFLERISHICHTSLLEHVCLRKSDR